MRVEVRCSCGQRVVMGGPESYVVAILAAISPRWRQRHDGSGHRWSYEVSEEGEHA